MIRVAEANKTLGSRSGVEVRSGPDPEQDRNQAVQLDILIMLKAIFVIVMGSPQHSDWKTRLVKGNFPDRSFDVEFWQEQGDEAIFAAAWEMVELAEEVSHGRSPRLQRTATTLKRI